VGGPHTGTVRQATVFAVVVALHAGLFGILAFALRTSTWPRNPSAELITTFITLPAPMPPEINRPHAPFPAESASISAARPPPAPPSQISVPGASIDWTAEAERAARAAIAPPRARAFGEMPQAPDWVHSAPTSPKHYAGEQYGLGTGEYIVWVSDRCFIVTEPAPLGTPDVFARSLVTRTVCPPPPAPREGELFKDLPAYKKYHPQ